MIEVILLERVGRIGQIGTVVKVKPGYARNFLLPRKKALRATKENLAYFESQRANIESANADARAKAEKQGEKVNGKSFTLIRQASEVGQLFGSVSVRDIAEVLKEAGFDIERQYVMLPAPLKMLGIHKIDVALHSEVHATITLNIARTEDEAKIQAKTGKAVNRHADNAPKAKAAPEEKAATEAADVFDTPPAATEADGAEKAAEG